MAERFPDLSLRGTRKYVNTPEIISAILQHFSNAGCEPCRYEIVFRKAVTGPVVIAASAPTSEALVVLRRTDGKSTEEYCLLPGSGTLESVEDVLSVGQHSLFDRGFRLESGATSLAQFLSDYFHVGKKWYLKYRQENSPIVRKISFGLPIAQTMQTVTYIQSLKMGYDRWLVYPEDAKEPIMELQTSSARLKTA